MVIDSSAIVAIVLNEPESDSFEASIKKDQRRLISAATVLESSIVLSRRLGEVGSELLDELIEGAAIQTIPVGLDHLASARDAFRRFGSGKNKLNFGDCFSYALAKVSGEPLLFKGEDFSATDLRLISLPPSPQST